MNRVANHSVKRTSEGFTLVELMLAMAFIAVLLIAIALTVIQISGIYNRGMALREVNQAARDVSSDIHGSITGAVPLDTNAKYVPTTSGGNGRLCLGQYSYIWNTARAFTAGGDPIKYENDTSRTVQLVRVPDPAGRYCDKSTGVLTQKDIKETDKTVAHELLDTGEHSLGLSSFSLGASPVKDTATGQALYTLDYSIIVGDSTTRDTATQTTCLQAAIVSAKNNYYCNVQQFSIVLKI